MTARVSLRDYFIMLFALYASGNPAVVSVDGIVPKLVYIFFLCAILMLYKPKLNWQERNTVKSWVIFFSVLFIVQYFVLGYVTVLGCINTIIKFVSAILLAFVLKERFKSTYFRVISDIAIISIPLYFLNVIGIHFPAIVKANQLGESIIIFNQMPENFFGQIRNAGCFWEPGVFSGYILLTFLLFFNDVDVLWKRHRIRVLLLIIALITTQSTTGFITLLIMSVVWTLIRYRKRQSVRIIALFLIVPIAYYSITRVSFLGNKIVSEYTAASEMEQGDVVYSRFGSIVFDWHYIQKHPIIGNGLSAETRYADHKSYFNVDELDGFGNGFSGIIGDLGILFLLFFFIELYKNKTTKNPLALILFTILLLQGEGFLKYPIFMSIPFIDYCGFILLYGKTKDSYFNDMSRSREVDIKVS